MPRQRILEDRKLTPAERQARRRAKLVSFRPRDKEALEAAAAASGKEASELVTDIVETWLRHRGPFEGEAAMTYFKPETIAARKLYRRLGELGYQKPGPNWLALRPFVCEVAKGVAAAPESFRAEAVEAAARQLGASLDEQGWGIGAGRADVLVPLVEEVLSELARQPEAEDADERIRKIRAQERQKHEGGRWHADLVAPSVAYVYAPDGSVAATLDDTEADQKRTDLTLLRTAVVMAASWEHHLALHGEELLVEYAD